MSSTLIGYFPKRRTVPSDLLKALEVEEIASVSTCIAKSPEDWIRQWRHNDLWLYDSPELAWSVVSPEQRAEFDLYGYRMFPLQIDDGIEKRFEIPQLSVTPMSNAFKMLGYDAVSRSTGAAFECSPLSCNHMADHIHTNKYCLLEDFQAALNAARTFGDEKCEPGPYFIIEVWRYTDPAV